MRVLLDTTVISDFAKGHPRVLARLKATPLRDVGVSVVTLMEVEYGLQINPARGRKLRRAIDALLRDLTVLPYEVRDGLTTAAIRAALRKRGTPIGPYDAMIAGTAVRHGLALATSNREEFERVASLAVEDWRE